MKKVTVISIISVLAVCLIVSWLFFWTQKNDASNLELIATRTDAVAVGRTYLEMASPILRHNKERFSYTALFYASMGEDGLWVVTSYDEETETSKNLPVVCFAKNGEIFDLSLQVD